MNRLNLSYEARQSLHAARRSVETAIREAKAVMRKPHVPGSGASEAQGDLVALRRKATLLYITLAAWRGREHCPTHAELLEALRKRAGSPYLSDSEKLVLGFHQAPKPPQPASDPVVSSPGG